MQWLRRFFFLVRFVTNNKTYNFDRQNVKLKVCFHKTLKRKTIFADLCKTKPGIEDCYVKLFPKLSVFFAHVFFSAKFSSIFCAILYILSLCNVLMVLRWILESYMLLIKKAKILGLQHFQLKRDTIFWQRFLSVLSLVLLNIFLIW